MGSVVGAVPRIVLETVTMIVLAIVFGIEIGIGTRNRYRHRWVSASVLYSYYSYMLWGGFRAFVLFLCESGRFEELPR